MKSLSNKILFLLSLIQNRYIRYFTAILLLAIFALSNTPVKVLHHFFANHVDQQTILQYKNGETQLQVAGIDCHVETNVVITPYVCGGGIIIKGILPSFAGYTILEKNVFHDIRLLYFELRGPPVTT